jgi:hypothetical protein
MLQELGIRLHTCRRHGPWPSHKALGLRLGNLRDRTIATPEAPVRPFLQAAMANLAASRSLILQDVFVHCEVGRDR